MSETWNVIQKNSVLGDVSYLIYVKETGRPVAETPRMSPLVKEGLRDVNEIIALRESLAVAEAERDRMREALLAIRDEIASEGRDGLLLIIRTALEVKP